MTAATTPAPSHAALEQLRDRLRAATGPDPSLENAIFAALRNATWYEEPRGIRSGTLRCDDGSRLLVRDVPALTGSIDAAVTLVPDAYVFEISQAFNKTPSFTAKIWRSDPMEVYANYGAQTHGGKTMTMNEYLGALRWERTPALALSLARIEFEIARLGA